MKDLYSNNMVGTGALSIPEDFDLDDKVSFDDDKVTFDDVEVKVEKKTELKVVSNKVVKSPKKTKKVKTKKLVSKVVEGAYKAKYETFKRLESRVEECLYEVLKETASTIDENSKNAPRSERYREKVTINSAMRALLANAEERLSKIDLSNISSEAELIEALS